MVNVIIGILTLVISSVVVGLLAGTMLPPILLRVALNPHAPSLATMNLLGTLALDATMIATVSLTGLLFGRIRRDLTFGQAICIGGVFLCLPFLLLLRSVNAVDATTIARAMPFRLVTVLAFLLPAAVGVSQGDTVRRFARPACLGAMAALTSLSLLLSPNSGPVRLQPLQPSAGLPRFGEAAIASRALSDGSLPLEESRKRARRAAVLQAADRVRAMPCDRGAREDLRMALVELLDNHIPTWYGPPSETMYAGGPVVNATRQLDGPALEVYRDALAAGIIRPEALSERARRELSFTHLGRPNPAMRSLVCPDG